MSSKIIAKWHKIVLKFYTFFSLQKFENDKKFSINWKHFEKHSKIMEERTFYGTGKYFLTSGFNVVEFRVNRQVGFSKSDFLVQGLLRAILRVSIAPIFWAMV